jgi:hypothetical protein
MDPYWVVFNPLTNGLLNIVFGLLLIVGVGILIINMVMLVFTYRRSGPILGIIISLLIIGISVDWEPFILFISQAMGGVVQYITYYLWLLIYQWLAQNGVPAAHALLLLL